MPLRRPLTSDSTQPAWLGTRLPSQRSTRKVLSLDQWKRPSKETLEEILSSALPVLDGELSHVLNEIDQISSSAKARIADTETLSDALQRAVWCAVKQTLLSRELHSLALTDDLTGLYNRRGFLASATQQLKLARRNAQMLLLFFCDVNGLKHINDCHGHREGDLALIRTADALEQTFRDSDILARLGGDEFVVLALETSSQNQEVMLRRLEKSLKKSNENESRYELALSVGVARFDAKRPISLGELIAQGDRAMYEQKRGAN